MAIIVRIFTPVLFPIICLKVNLVYNFSGIFSEACIKLAHMHSDAVDFPKTGKCPALPKDLRPDQYPDFMMKPGKPRYK